MEENKTRTPLRKAVDHLISTGQLNADKDLSDLFGLSASTISGYLTGKPGKNFVRDFQNKFKLDLKNFEKVGEVEETETVGMSNSRLDKLIDANLQLAESQRKLADANERLTRLLEEKANLQPVSAAPQIPEVVQATLGAVREFLLDVSTGHSYKSRQEAEAAFLRKYDPVPAPKISVKGIQKG